VRRLIYSMAVSLDGYIAGPRGEADWAAPGEELHRFHNEQARELGLHLLGRRLYEVMKEGSGAETSAQRAACASSHRSTAPLASSTAASGVAP
jgi:dihydrofolate reductase